MVFEYYTYSGFNIIVPVFQSIAILFKSDDYLHLFAVFAIAGVFLVTFFSTVKSLSGQASSPLKWVVPFLLSITFFKGLMLPKADVTVYDPVNNQSQVVSDVPLAIAMVAGVFNLIEHSVVEVIGLATGSVYDEDAVGISFSLIREASRRSFTATDGYLAKNIEAYIKRCGEIAINSAVAVSDTFINRGTDDLRLGLKGMAMPAWDTVVFDSSNKNGLVVDCKTAWEDHIKNELQDADFDNMMRELCKSVGFDVGSLAQVTQCRNRMDDSMELFGISTGTYAPEHFVRSFYLAQRFAVAVRDNPDLATLSMANRNALVQGVGMFTVASEWIPQIKAITTGISLSLIPILALLIVTPLAGKALIYLCGLFGWLTLWGAIDAILHGMSFSAASAFYENVSSLGMGLDGLYRSADASTQAIALFGKIRTFSIMLASALALPLFGFGGYSWSQISEGLAQHLENIGSDAAMKTQTPEGTSQTLNQMTDAMSTMSLHAQHSAGAIAQNSFMSNNAAVSASQQLASQGAKQGLTPASISNYMGVTQGATQFGEFKALQGLTAARGQSITDPGALAQTAQRIASDEKTVSGAGSLSKGRVLESGLGSLAENALTASTVDSNQWLAGTKLTQDLTSTIQQQTNSSESEAFKSLAGYERANTRSSIDATDGDVNQFQKTVSDTQAMDLARQAEMIKVGKDAGLSPGHIGKTSGIFDGSKLVGEHDALHQLSGSDLSETSQTETLSRWASASVKSDIVDFAQVKGSSRKDAHESVEQFAQTGLFASVLATDGNANKYLATMANSETFNLAQKEQMFQTGLDLNMSPQSMGEAYAKFEAASIHGKHQVLDQMTPSEIAFGYAANNLNHAVKADQLQQVAAEQGKDLKTFMEGAEGLEAAERMARVLKTDAIARHFAETNTEAMLRQNGAQTVVTLSGDTAKHFAEKFFGENSVSGEQSESDKRNYDWIMQKADQGEVIHASYSMDFTDEPDNPTVGNIKLHSDNTVSEDHSMRTTTGVQSIIVQPNELSAFEAFTGQDRNNVAHRAIREAIYEDRADDGEFNDVATVSALNNLGRFVGTFGQVRLSDYDSSSGSASISVDTFGQFKGSLDTSKQVAGWLGQKLTGVKAEASVGVNAKGGGTLTGTTGSTEDYSTSSFNQMALQHLNNTLQSIDKQIASNGWDLNHEDPVDRNQAREFRDQKFVQSMDAFLGEYINTMVEKGQHNMKDSDESGLLKTDFGKSMMNKVQDDAVTEQLSAAEKF